MPLQWPLSGVGCAVRDAERETTPEEVFSNVSFDLSWDGLDITSSHKHADVDCSVVFKFGVEREPAAP